MSKLRDLMRFVLLVSMVSVLLFLLSYTVHGYGNWAFVIMNTLFFALFILFIQFRRKTGRLPASVYLAFIFALYAEMYGFPLTMYIFMWLLGYKNVYTVEFLIAGLLGEDFFAHIFLFFILPVSTMIMLIGIVFIVLSWRKIFRAKGQLVTTGIYRHVRHPQYLGFLLLTLGMNVQWMTILTLWLWPILTILYYRLAKEEDKEMEKQFGEEYRKYKNTVPMFIPKIRIKGFFER